VVIARYRGEEVALKVKRLDADRPSLEEEAGHLRLANRVCVGPVFLGSSGDFLLMELIEGEYLVDWVAGLGASDVGLVQEVLRRLLEKAWRLDDLGLDHGELSRARRHVIVSEGEARIIDFESASTGRRCSNLTSIVQYMFFSGVMAVALGRVLLAPDRSVLLGALRAYKRAPSEVRFRGVLDACGLLA
jgi:putative serine/threonine protein kinase